MARSFNSTTDKIASAANEPASGGFSFSCWVWTTGAGGSLRCLWRGGASGNGGNGVYLSGLQLVMLDAVGVDTTSINVTANSWTHIAATGSIGGATNIIPYGNAVPSTTALTHTWAAADTSLLIGNDAFSQPLNSGSNVNYVADFAWWNTILASSSITALFNGLRPTYAVGSSALVLWYPFDGYASPETDLSSNANNGTLTGTTQIIGPPPLWRVAQGA